MNGIPSRKFYRARVVVYIRHIGDYHAPRLQQLKADLTKVGYELIVVEGAKNSLLYNHTQNRRSVRDNLTIIPLNSRSTADLVRKLVISIFRLRPDVLVQLGYHDIPAFVGLVCAKSLRRKVYFLSDSKRDDQPRSQLTEIVKSLIVRRFNGALVAGNRHRSYFSELGMNSASISTGYDVVDNDFFARRAEIYRTKEALIRRLSIVPSRYILVVSRLVTRKRVELAIDLFARSNLRENGVKLLIIGSGPLEENIRQLIYDRGLAECVVMRKNVANKQMPLFYTFADAMVLASEYDQWGLCVNEAMACGTPVLLTERCGAAHEIVHHGRNGYVWDGERIEEGVRLLNSLVLNDNVRSEFSKQSVATMNSWGLDRFSSALTKLILNAPATSGTTSKSRSLFDIAS